MTGSLRDERGRTVDLGGPVHYVDFGGAPTGLTFVLVHGLGGSHLNWELLAPRLTGRGRVLAVDLPGFGLSEPGERPATVPANVKVLERFLRVVTEPPVVLVGNSMGGMISILLAAGTPELVRALVLVDPALPPPVRPQHAATGLVFGAYALPGIGEQLTTLRRRRLGPRATVDAVLRLCGVEPSQLPRELVERSVVLIANRRDVAGMDRAFLSATRSLLWALVRSGAYRSAMSSVTAPVLLVHGDRDRLVPVSAARGAARRHPAWRYIELRGVGHVPQLQVPDLLADHLLEWLGAVPGAAGLGDGPA
jgi:pimeloyl-ACP methyl ester carboxylesterase